MATRPATLDPLALYELCVTSPVPTARFLRAAHGGSPRTLGEDFSGSAALARAWIGLAPEHRAIAVDHDPAVLARAAREAGDAARLKTLAADVLRVRRRVDILACTNFPICYWHHRPALVRYLRHACARLNAGGVLVCDLYGGSDAFCAGSYTRVLRGPAGERIEYTWEQRHADPLTGRVGNAISFRVGPARRNAVARRGRKAARVLRDAFVYDWRLWSIPELRDAMAEAGFAEVDVYARLGDAMDGDGNVIVSPVTDPSELPDPWVVYVAGRTRRARRH